MFANIIIQDTSVLFSTTRNIFFGAPDWAMGDFWIAQDGEPGEYLVAGQYPVISVTTASGRVVEDCTCPPVVIGWRHSLTIMDSEGNKLQFVFDDEFGDGEVSHCPAPVVPQVVVENKIELTRRRFSDNMDQSLEYNCGEPFEVLCTACGQMILSDEADWARRGPAEDYTYYITCNKCKK